MTRLKNNGNLELFKIKQEIGTHIINLANTTPYTIKQVVDLLERLTCLAQAGGFSIENMVPNSSEKLKEKLTMDQFLKELDELTEKYLKDYCKDINHLIGVRLGYYLGKKEQIKGSD